MSAADPSAIVVGAGALGAATADALVARGWSVTVVERYAPANARGSSGDRTRLLRLGHGEWDEATDLWHVRSAARGIALWRELSEQEDADLLQRTGLVWLARSEDGVEAQAQRRLEACGAACERLAPEQLRDLFEDVETGDLAFALHEPDASVIRAGTAVETLLRRARRGGARLLLDDARPGGPGQVRLASGDTLTADHVVWACGAWLGALLPDDAPVRPAWQDVLHWNGAPAWRGGPAWIDAGDGEGIGTYGFPDVDGLGVKAVTHVPGPAFDLDRDERIPRARSIAELSAYVGHRFPALRDSGLLWARVLPYEMTPDGHFVAGPCRELERHWVLGGGSGHAFKHAPALGEHVAGLLEGTAEVVPFHAPGPRGAHSPGR